MNRRVGQAPARKWLLFSGITDERIDDEFIEAVIDTGLDGARRITPDKPAPTPPDSQF